MFHRGSVAAAHRLESVALVGLWHVGSSLNRGGTHVPGIERWILNHWTTREVRGPRSYLLEVLGLISQRLRWGGSWLRNQPMRIIVLSFNILVCCSQARWPWSSHLVLYFALFHLCALVGCLALMMKGDICALGPILYTLGYFISKSQFLLQTLSIPGAST